MKASHPCRAYSALEARCAKPPDSSLYSRCFFCRIRDDEGEGEPVAEATFSAADKNARALRKKLKQVDALLERQKAGSELTGPETDKIGKAAEW